MREGGVAACRIDAGAGFSMRCRRLQELRAYPMSKRGWMGFAGPSGLPVRPVSVRQGFVLKGFFVVFERFPAAVPLQMSRFIDV
ncbi:hypothetical protein [Burkholderia diffusa]|uniref:hypothetical protein n=1 Tax=Burkholderia diffusa TaxID=488732 RepID=UPI00157AC61D|nr:hypothetical protein [Burkholderia diffusa]NTY40499.1 hypothetical protein [Burkholderia diffusa]